MDLKTMMATIDISNINSQLKEVIDMVKDENSKVVLNDGEDRVYILLDIKQKDITAYRVTMGVDTFPLKENLTKQYNTVKRTIGKYTLQDMKNLVPGEDLSGIESTIRRVMPLIYGMNSLIRLIGNEKKVMIQLDISDTDIIAYQVVTAIIEKKPTDFYLVISRVLGQHILSEYIK